MQKDKTVIVVDDCADTSETLKTCLELDGFDVLAFTDLDSAKNMLPRGGYCGALLDYRVNGSVTSVEEFIREMKRRHPQAAVYIYSGDHRVKDEWHRIQADGFFLKPVEAEVLTEALARHCPRNGNGKSNGNGSGNGNGNGHSHS
ncbi:MAG TPA: response regulator [Planctomycetota bacterium]|nr:response regulator [Planctomycetota bacterium]